LAPKDLAYAKILEGGLLFDSPRRLVYLMRRILWAFLC